ncbi:hypothetical protein BT93_H1427 [Corymbia citriodora subsp. variegata]|nr:hypothetical protein BT93_H1427 [Corymbia citriodora subsp. variegata]
MPPISLERSIFKVRHPLRDVNEKAYDPKILAIRPYHHENHKYKFMEEQKLRYLQRLLERRNKESIDKCIIGRDLLLLENQVPLFILSTLYDLTKGPDEHHEFSYVAIEYFKIELRCPSQYRTIDKSQGEHLLHLYQMWRTSVLPKTPPQKCTIVMPSAIELRESGNGTLEIPVLYVEDNTETQFRNLIAYEQYHLSRGINYFTDYVKFLDCLINSSKDVKVLCRAGIIKNYLGDDEVVAQMFNKIGDYITVPGSYYFEIFKNVNAYCKKPRNIQMAKLRREYFHSPWAFLSILTAIMLLLLTAAQTVFSILSYKKQS